MEIKRCSYIGENLYSVTVRSKVGCDGPQENFIVLAHDYGEALQVASGVYPGCIEGVDDIVIALLHGDIIVGHTE